MICKVLHYVVNRGVVHPRCLDRVVRRLHMLQREQNILTPVCWRIRCSSGWHMNDNPSGKLTFLNVETKNLPQVVSALCYSSQEREKINLKDSDVAGLKKDVGTVEQLEDEKKLTLFQQFKKMYRDYWYVLVPVHVITSLGWLGGFYFIAKSGVDIVSIVESLGVGDHIPAVLKDSHAGYLAVTYALYKIATPVRYMVTIGGTTISIKYLKEYGYIKPIPPKEKLKEMYEEKKENLKEKSQNLTDGLKHKKDQLKERGQTFIRERRHQAQK